MAKKIGALSISMLILNILGYPFMILEGVYFIILYNIFILITFFCLLYYWKTPLNKYLLPLFFFAYWLLHNSLAFFRVSYLQKFTQTEIIKCFIIVIISTLVVFIGVIFTKYIKVKPIKIFKDLKISHATYYSLLIITLIYIILKFYYSGGIRNYFFGNYQYKMPANLQTIFFVIKNIVTNFNYLNLIYVIGDKKKTITKVSRCYFIIAIFDIFAGGGSTGILYLFLSLVLLKLITSKTIREQKKQTYRLVPVAFIGAFIGLLIRYNRTDYSTFNFDVLNNVMENLISSATFDCLENSIRVFRDFSPTYTFGQLIYPFVSFLPRNIFTWKPEELGNIIASTYYNFAQSANAGFGPSPMAEFYFDFGWLGLFLGMIFIGIILGWFQKKINVSEKNLFSMCLLITIMVHISTLPNWYTGFGIRIVYLGIYLILMYIVEAFFRHFIR